jgi:hypothetical protein
VGAQDLLVASYCHDLIAAEYNSLSNRESVIHGKSSPIEQNGIGVALASTAAKSVLTSIATELVYLPISGQRA